MIHELLEFLSAFPALNGKTVTINHLDEPIGSLALENASNAYTVKEYTDGERLCAVRFVLAAREALTLSKSANAAIAGFFEELCDWLDAKTASNTLPQLGKNRTSVSVLPCGSHYVKSTAGSAARYELVIELRYYETI